MGDSIEKRREEERRGEEKRREEKRGEEKSTRTYETFGCIVHKSQLEALLVEERLSQSPAQSIRRKGRFVAVLQLGKQFLQQEQEDDELAVPVDSTAMDGT